MPSAFASFKRSWPNVWQVKRCRPCRALASEWVGAGLAERGGDGDGAADANSGTRGGAWHGGKWGVERGEGDAEWQRQWQREWRTAAADDSGLVRPGTNEQWNGGQRKQDRGMKPESRPALSPFLCLPWVVAQLAKVTRPFQAGAGPCTGWKACVTLRSRIAILRRTSSSTSSATL